MFTAKPALLRLSNLLAAAAILSAPTAALGAPPRCASCHFEKVASCGGFLEGPTIDDGNRLRVVNLANGDILEVSQGKCTPVANSGGLANGARLDREGRLYVADQQRGILALKDGKLVVEIAPPPGASHANDIAFDSRGGLYFTMPGTSSYSARTGRLYYRPARPGAATVLVQDGLAFPNGLVVSPDGKYVWVGQFADKTILAVPAADSGEALKMPYLLLRTEGGIGPDGMIVDSRKRLIWANFGGKSLGVASADGKMIGTVDLPEEAGPLVTNVAEHKGVYYITEARKGEVWKLTGLDEFQP